MLRLWQLHKYTPRNQVQIFSVKKCIEASEVKLTTDLYFIPFE